MHPEVCDPQWVSIAVRTPACSEPGEGAGARLQCPCTLLRPVWVFVLFCLQQKYLSSPCLPHQWLDCLHQIHSNLEQKLLTYLMRSTPIFRPRCSHPHTFQRQAWLSLYKNLLPAHSLLSHPNQKRGAAPSGLSELDWAQTYSYGAAWSSTGSNSQHTYLGNSLLHWARVWFSLSKPVYHSQHRRNTKQRPLYQISNTLFSLLLRWYHCSVITVKVGQGPETVITQQCWFSGGNSQPYLQLMPWFWPFLLTHKAELHPGYMTVQVAPQSGTDGKLSGFCTAGQEWLICSPFPF